MGACVSLLIFQPVFQFQPSLTEKQIPLRHKVPRSSVKTDIRIEGTGNAAVQKAGGSAPLSGDGITPASTGSAARGATWFKDKTCPCMTGWGICTALWVHEQQGQAHTFHSQRYPSLFSAGKHENIYSCKMEGQSTRAYWCDLEEHQGEIETCTPSSSHPHVAWLALLPNSAQQDSKFRSHLPKSHSLCNRIRPQSFILTQRKSGQMDLEMQNAHLNGC